MNIDKIKVNKIHTFKKRGDVDLASTFLEKKYCKKINFTLFGGNKVIFVTGNDNTIQKKVIYLNDSDILINHAQDIFDDIINYNTFSSKGLRKKLIHGIYFNESENSFSIMKIKLSENIIKEKNIRTIFHRIFSDEKNSSKLTIELSLLEFLNIYFVDIKNIHKRMFIDDIVDIFIKVFQYQNGKQINFYFNKEYFLKYHDISIE
jgi:hypothetical protein